MYLNHIVLLTGYSKTELIGKRHNILRYEKTENRIYKRVMGRQSIIKKKFGKVRLQMLKGWRNF